MFEIYLNGSHEPYASQVESIYWVERILEDIELEHGPIDCDLSVIENGHIYVETK
jgi:hypothetical protein